MHTTAGRAAAVVALLALSSNAAAADRRRLIPAGARAAAVIDLKDLRDWIARSPAMERDLRDYLRRHSGIDLTLARSAVVWVSRFEPSPSVGVLLELKGKVQLKGKRAGRHRGVPVVAFDEPRAFGALLPAGLVVGHHAEVKAAIDIARRRGRGLNPDAPLGGLLAVKARDPLVLAAVHGPSLPDRGLQQLVRRFALGSAVLTIDRSYKVRAAISGQRPRRLQMARTMVDRALSLGLSKLRRARDRATRRDELGAALAAVVQYHQARELVDQLRPRVEGGRLVSSYQIPRLDSPATLMAAAGIAAAVAVPAFIKYLRRARTSEALQNLARIRAGVKAYHVEHGALPPSVGWTPARSCCSGGSTRCTPGRRTFAHPTWRKLRFALTTPHHYQYRFSARGKGRDASFEIEARGDLDCDGTHSSFKIRGRVNPDGSLGHIGPIISNELE